MNKGDSDLIRRSLIDAGFVETDTISDASIALYNTCSVREHAEQRATGIINANKRIVKNNGGITVVTGCMAQRLGAELVNNGIADLVIGPYQSPQAGAIVNEYLENGRPTIFLSQRIEDLADRLPIRNPELLEKNTWHHWVTISHGCDNRCTYCIVPSVRGPLISYPSKNIIRYLQELAINGIREVTLLGQNVNQYGIDSGDMPFYLLLEKTALIKGFDRVNFLTSHPRDFTADIIGVIKDHDNVSKSIHLPLQSGSDRILNLMNRGYRMSDYYRLVELMHRELSSFSLSTDLMVGFPGETRDEFDETLKAVASIRFDDAFTYAYSPREDTPAFPLHDTCGKDDKKFRLMELIAVQRKISSEKLFERINSVENTIIERISKKSTRSVMGKTFLNHPVIIPGSIEDIGMKITVKINGVKGSTLQGERIA